MSEEPKKQADQAQTVSEQVSAEAADRPRESDAPTEGRDTTGQELSDHAANHAEKATEAEKEEGSIAGNADRLTVGLDKLAEAELADRKPSNLEVVIDKIVLLSHDESLGRGNDRFIDEDSISMVPSLEPGPTLDLIRERPGKGPIFVSLVEWRQSRPKLLYGSSIMYHEQ